MKKEIKTILGVSVAVFIVSMVVSYLFGGYDPVVKVEANVLVLVPILLGVLIPILTVSGLMIYGVIGLSKKDYKRFLWAVGIAVCLLILLFVFSFPPLLVK